MTKFRVIPVIDILNSKAVHAKKGKRELYKPLNSKIIPTSEPFRIIKTLNNSYEFDEFYIADLDSIMNRNPNLALLSAQRASMEIFCVLLNQLDFFPFETSTCAIDCHVKS